MNMAEIRTKPQAPSEATEAQIAVHWREEEYYYPPAKFAGQANLTDPDIMERFSEKNFPECFREYADLLDWDQYWHTTLDTSDPPFWKWFDSPMVLWSKKLLTRVRKVSASRVQPRKGMV